jgi:hypothetical protein
MITLFGGMIFRWNRYRQAQRAYLRHFPPVAGYLLEEYLDRNPWSLVDRAINAVARQPQDEPELERLRRAIWRQLRYFVLWIFGVPLLTVGVVLGVVAFLTLIGALH